MALTSKYDLRPNWSPKRAKTVKAKKRKRKRKKKKKKREEPREVWNFGFLYGNQP